MNELKTQVNTGDVIEFTLGGERVTAVALLIGDDGEILLDLVDEDVFAWSEIASLSDLAVFKPDVGEALVAA
jgi:hypothetical protein